MIFTLLEDKTKSVDTSQCHFCDKPAVCQIGMAYFNKRDPEKLLGYVCADHIQNGITNIMKQVFGTKLWATVHDLDGKLLYQSYDAYKSGFEASAGWGIEDLHV